jgi:hypothetical protein
MVQTPIKPKTSERQEVISWLKTHGYPALPVAPAQDARKYPKIVQENREKGTWQQCPLTSELQPVPLYTGKNPSYLDQNGKPHLVNHRQYQKRLPSDRELKDWFANPLNGVGTLGGWPNTIWIDFDVKQFSSQEECNAVVLKILERPELQQTFIERSHSGGWRIGVRVKQEPDFTNFALQPGGKHIGEALGEGRFTVLAPTVGPSGNPYRSINRSTPVEVMSLESIGIHTTSVKRQHQGVTSQPGFSYVPGSIPLEQLGTDTSREILNGSCPTGDRSEALTTALNEWYGWQNWAKENDIDVTGTPEDLAHYAGSQLGIDSDKVNRILKTIDIVSSDPAALHRGGDESCWKKIHRLDKAAFEAKCPAHIKDGIKAEWQRNSNKTGGDGGDQRDHIVEGNKASNNNSSRLSIREAIAKAEEILETETDSLVQKIKLEELRQQTGINSYEWNVEYINLIRSKLERQLAQDSRKEQRRQALLAIACEKDPDEREDLIVALCRKSGWRRQYVESRIDSLKAEEIKPKAQRMTFKEFMEAENEPVKWIYSGLIPLLGVTLFSGDAGAGKSSTATDLAVSFLSGDEFLGEVPGVPGRVLYVIDDEPDGFLRERLMHRFPLIDCPQFEVIPHWDVSQMDLLIETIKDFRPSLVIVDSYNSIHSTDPNYDENSSKAGKTIRTFDALSQTYGCGFVVIHHNGKGKDRQGVHKVRGSTDIPAAASTVLLFEKCPNGVYRQIKVEKTRAGTGNRTLTVGFDESTKRLILVNSGAEDKETKSLSQHILNFLESNQGTLFEQAEVQMHLQLNNSNSVYAALKRLADRSQIVRRPSKKINAGRRCLIYGIPTTVTPPPSTQETPPPVCVKVSDLEAVNYTTQGVDKSDTKSDTKSDVNLTWELSNDYQKNSNADSVGNSVNLTDNMTVGSVCSDPGVSDSTVTFTSDNALATDPWEEKYTAINVDADGWGEIIRNEEVQPEAIAPCPAPPENVESPHVIEQPPLPIYQRSDGGFVAVEAAIAPEPKITPRKIKIQGIDNWQPTQPVGMSDISPNTARAGDIAVDVLQQMVEQAQPEAIAPCPVEQLAELLRGVQSWEELQRDVEALGADPQIKAGAWKLLTGQDKARIKSLKPIASSPVQPENVELSHVIEQPTKASDIAAGDIVRFTNPLGQESSRQFEGIDLKVVKLMSTKMPLVLCVLPDGTERTFHVSGLVARE